MSAMQIALESQRIGLHQHDLPFSRLNFLVMLDKNGSVAYTFDGTGAFYCRNCKKLMYGEAHHCRVCVPTFEVCRDCFSTLKASELASPKTKVFFNPQEAPTEKVSDAIDDASSEEEDIFALAGAKRIEQKLSPSFVMLDQVKNRDFGPLVKALFTVRTSDAEEDSTPRVDFAVADEETGRNMIHYAADAGHDRAVLGLLMHVQPAVYSRQDHLGLTPLMLAAIAGHSAVVEELLFGHAELETKCMKGYTALLLAACYGHADVVSRLLFSGASVNVVTCDGRSAVSIAALNGHPACAKLLLQCPQADKSITDSEGYTALLLAVACGHMDIADLFDEEDRKALLW
eukprot:gene10153-15611_t